MYVYVCMYAKSTHIRIGMLEMAAIRPTITPVCMHVCMYMYVKSTRMSILYACMFVYVCLGMYVYLCMYVKSTRISILYACMFMYACLCMYVCMSKVHV